MKVKRTSKLNTVHQLALPTCSQLGNNESKIDNGADVRYFFIHLIFFHFFVVQHLLRSVINIDPAKWEIWDKWKKKWIWMNNDNSLSRLSDICIRNESHFFPLFRNNNNNNNNNNWSFRIVFGRNDHWLNWKNNINSRCIICKFYFNLNLNLYANCANCKVQSTKHPVKLFRIEIYLHMKQKKTPKPKQTENIFHFTSVCWKKCTYKAEYEEKSDRKTSDDKI